MGLGERTACMWLRIVMCAVSNHTSTHHLDMMCPMCLMCLISNASSGTIDAYYQYNLKPWDMAAGALIIEEAGGWVMCVRVCVYGGHVAVKMFWRRDMTTQGWCE